ncbi:MAG: hypothetical protein ABI382_00815 [Nakamurella sp.]
MTRNLSFPEVEGARIAQGLDAMQVSWWAVRGELYSVRAYHGWRRVLRAFAACFELTVWPFTAAARYFSISCGRRRYYFSPDGSSVMAIAKDRRGWFLTDYLSAHPGHGEGWWLRQQVVPAACAAADRRHIPIYLSPMPSRIAESCEAENPELRRVPRRRHGLIALQRKL